MFYPGAVCEHYLLVLEGSVKAQIISEAGREMLLYRVRSGDSCVLTTSCLLSGDQYPAEGITEDQVLATKLGSAREVISRYLKRFEAYGWVALNRGAISLLDAGALKNVATK
ncbi:MAG TPA: hypothetical protein EYG48_05005 [Methylococcales bacterium]|nr:hypothetical protein [Methylococcales bacterium]